MKKPSERTAKLVAALATPIAMVVAGAMIWQASYAAFSGQTRNSGNEWSTGSVTLTDDDSGTARFTVTDMVPGDTATKCITVTSNASVPGTVKGYVVNPRFESQVLASAVLVTVDSGTGGSFADCTGFTSQGTVVPTTSLQDLAAFNDYDSGVGGWDVSAGTESRTYQITWTFDTAGLTQEEIDGLQGSVVGLDFQWELRSS